MVHLREQGWECRELLDEGVQIPGNISPINIWIYKHYIICFDKMLSVYNPDVFDKITLLIDRRI